MPKGVYAYDIRMVFVIWSSGENQTMAIERVGREALGVRGWSPQWGQRLSPWSWGLCHPEADDIFALEGHSKQ